MGIFTAVGASAVQLLSVESARIYGIPTSEALIC